LLHGKFKTPKNNKLNLLIQWINTNYKFYKLLLNPIDLSVIDISPINRNAWFSGFSEGDGSFQIRLSEPNNNSLYYHISTIF